MPFWYKGENIYLTLWMLNDYDVHMKYRYMAYDDAEAEYASLMRSGNYCFSPESQADILEFFGVPLMYELPEQDGETTVEVRDTDITGETQPEIAAA